MTGTFAPGARLIGRITEPGYEHVTLEILVERFEPEELFSYRWRPYAVEASADRANEPTTAVEFRLATVADGTELTVVESGFDQLPPERRVDAIRMNDQGWAEQVRRIERYVTAQPNVA